MSFQLVKLLDALSLNNTNVVITSGLVPKGIFNALTSYNVGDFVSYGTNTYVLYEAAVAGTLPTDNTKWMIISSLGALNPLQKYEKNDVGSVCDGISGATGRVWTLSNTIVISYAIVIRNGGILTPSDYVLTTTGTNDTLTFTNTNIFDDDNIRILGWL